MSQPPAPRNTPGPWRALGARTLSGGLYHQVKDADGELVAETATVRGDDREAMESDAADARLIAAAPDLLAALYAAMFFVPIGTNARAAGDAAIARAEGRA